MDLDGVGGRCSLSSCRRVDYLPFTCPHCAGLFCDEHFLPAAHACARAPPAAGRVPECPICGAPVPATRGDDDPGAALARHIDAGCPARRRANPVCAAAGCETRDIAPVTCRACGEKYCLAHRLEADHDCGRPGARRAAAAAARLPTAASGTTTATAAIARLSIGSGDRGSNLRGGGVTPGQKILSFGKRRSRNAAGEVERRGSSSTAAGPSGPRVGKGAGEHGGTAAPPLGMRLTTFANASSAPRGDKNIPEDCRISVAVHYPVHLGRKSEYWVLNSRHSAGKILDALNLPPPPPDAASERYSAYAVKNGGKGVNLLPTIVPLRDLGREVIHDGDNIVVEVGDRGLSPDWMAAVKAANLPTVKSTRARATRASKCVIA